jgi:hypothetical protein
LSGGDGVTATAAALPDVNSAFPLPVDLARAEERRGDAPKSTRRGLRVVTPPRSSLSDFCRAPRALLSVRGSWSDTTIPVPGVTTGANADRSPAAEARSLRDGAILFRMSDSEYCNMQANALRGVGSSSNNNLEEVEGACVDDGERGRKEFLSDACRLADDLTRSTFIHRIANSRSFFRGARVTCLPRE